MKSLRPSRTRATRGQLKKRKNRIEKIVGKVRLFARSVFVSLMTLGITFFPMAVKVVAASPTYQAQVSAAETTLAAGSSQQITLKFKNVGTTTWIGSRAETSLYLYGDSSVFGHASWIANDHPSLIVQSKVAPGTMASAVFWVKAPPTAGTYTEKFLLSYGPNAWIKGSVVAVTFHVTGSASASPAVTSPAPGSSTLNTSDWKAELVDKGGTEWQLDPQGHTMLTLAFKNRGNRTWAKLGGLPMELVTSALHKSSFKDFSWKSDSFAAELVEDSVRPGTIGHFVLELRAPNTPGKYQEAFQLALGGTQFVSGGSVTLPISVTETRTTIAQGISAGSNTSIGDAYKAALLLTSTKSVALAGSAKVDLTFGFKNLGSATWNSLSLRTSQASNVYDSSWFSGAEPVKTEKMTQPGEIGFLAFTLKAPPKKGIYTASFQLYADNQPIENGAIDIPITVTADGSIDNPSSPIPVVTPPTSQAPVIQPSGPLPAEPMIRVGLFATTDNQTKLRAVSGGFKLQQNATTACTFSSGEIVTVSYDRANKIYKAIGPRCSVQSAGIYVAVADDGLAPLEMTDFSRPVSWLPGANDNKFRGKLELRYTPATDSVWVINELPIEWYLKGIGETSNSSPMEYQKALLTAARTYAMYHVQHGTKHASENYIVDAKYDQVYRGYGAEARDPAVVAAVDATRGQIVTYDGKLAITPYYSRSDGRTRDWKEVWGGSGMPWLVSVKVPWDDGKTLWGHGVGMAATGALGMAADGWIYDHILNYFYTGTQLTRIYQ